MSKSKKAYRLNSPIPIEVDVYEAQFMNKELNLLVINIIHKSKLYSNQ